VLAIELLAATQAYDVQPVARNKAPRTARLYEAVRRHVPFYADDRPMHEDIETVRGLIRKPVSETLGG